MQIDSNVVIAGSSVSQTEQSSSDGSGVFGVTRCGSTGSIHSAPYFTQRIRSKVQDLAVKSRLITDQVLLRDC